MIVDAIAALLGGLGLFLLAVSMITDGLRLAAGDKLREILSRSTATRWRGVVSGMFLTGIVQSSSAVTVATIGFVNAGLLTIAQALGVVYGANIGTTMTGWLVAAIGFDIRIDAVALPMIGLGMAARLIGRSSSVGPLGEAIAGFGLMFVGIDLLRESFDGFSSAFGVDRLSIESGAGLLFYVLGGFLATLITQSSSAAIALTLSAANGGMLGIDAAAAMVIGANVGTTSTAVISVIGATANAKRVAAAHVLFNVVTGVIALLLLPLLIRFAEFVGQFLGLEDVPAVSLALFHTVFNVLGVLVIWRATGHLSRFLTARFTTPAEQLGKPRYLDRTVSVTPVLALNALVLELQRSGQMCRKLAIEVVRHREGREPPSSEDYYQGILALTGAASDFISHVERDRLSDAVSNELRQALRVNIYFEEVADLAHELRGRRSAVASLRTMETDAAIEQFELAVMAAIDRSDPTRADYSAEQLDELYDALRSGWHDLKTVLLDAATRGKLPMARLNTGMEGLRSYVRMVEQLAKAAARLNALAATASADMGDGAMYADAATPGAR